MKRLNYLLLLLALSLIFVSCTDSSKNESIGQVEGVNEEALASGDDITEPADQEIKHGLIYLVGEAHGVKKILDAELKLWDDYYTNLDMRHMFIESPYYTGEFLNMWMKADNDDILDKIYNDWSGTPAHNPYIKDFYKTIKEKYPETVFHGTDVGHQYKTTGKRYLEYLESEGLEETEAYRRAKEVSKQGEMFYGSRSSSFREEKMVENFIYEFDKLIGEDVYGIYGSAHTGLNEMDFSGKVPSMANQLKEHYGDIISSENLSYMQKDIDPIRVDVITLEGKLYDASYFGKVERFGQKNIDYIDFYRIENAYEDFKDHPLNNNVLPYSNYPMLMEQGQVYMIEVFLTDGNVRISYYRSDGTTWNDLETTLEFIVE
ncbi:hypothetical protein EZV73_14670 [Acidaminobacter sp. JC074]|uniref:hypothetical protein n=1 Tax=Acidaminobacter sp. JC074 TaxID=2530199 RepID=UPI001F11425F|nr:hypothetical protein [Acidaminobacter sp. JC074]MCH4888836.1 hypothetical protein [Acidaminobacter sp. JC074]